MDTITEYRTVKELVRTLLEIDERCRNDDKWLTYRVMSHYTEIFIPFEDFIKLPSFETISRVRRTIQNKEGEFLPTNDDVMLQRASRMGDIKDMVLWDFL